MTSNYLSRWSKPNQPTPHRVTLRTLIPICQHHPKPIWPDWIRYKMLTLRNCANIIWWKVRYTGSVTFLTVSANHFHQINAHYRIISTILLPSTTFSLFFKIRPHDLDCNLFDLSVLGCCLSKFDVVQVSCRSDYRKPCPWKLFQNMANVTLDGGSKPKLPFFTSTLVSLCILLVWMTTTKSSQFIRFGSHIFVILIKKWEQWKAIQAIDWYFK